MAYSEALADRVRTLVSRKHRVVERKMFGGLAFMVRGHMCCGIQGEELMARVGPDRYGDALKWPGARPMDFTGKPMPGFVYVGTGGLRPDAQLRRCVDATLAFALTMPSKPKRQSRSRGPKDRSAQSRAK